MEVSFNTPEIADIVIAAFPDSASQRRNVKVDTRTHVRPLDYWDGGSRTYCRFVALATHQVVAAPAINPLVARAPEYELPHGIVMVEHVIFQGKDLGYRINIRPENLNPTMLPPAPQISDRDRRILLAFRSLKSGPYRKEALRALQYTQADQDRLQAEGYLKVASNGATQITNKGRIVCA